MTCNTHCIGHLWYSGIIYRTSMLTHSTTAGLLTTIWILILLSTCLSTSKGYCYLECSSATFFAPGWFCRKPKGHFVPSVRVWQSMDIQGPSEAKVTRIPKATLTNILRFVVVISLCSYLSSRVYVAYTKLEEGKIGTLFNRITSATVQVSFCVT